MLLNLLLFTLFIIIEQVQVVVIILSERLESFTTVHVLKAPLHSINNS